LDFSTDLITALIAHSNTRRYSPAQTPP